MLSETEFAILDDVTARQILQEEAGQSTSVFDWICKLQEAYHGVFERISDGRIYIWFCFWVYISIYKCLHLCTFACIGIE